MKTWKKVVLISIGSIVLVLVVFSVIADYQPDISSFDIPKTLDISMPDNLKYNMREIDRSGLLKIEPVIQPDEYGHEFVAYTGGDPKIVLYERLYKGAPSGGRCYYPDEKFLADYAIDDTLSMYTPNVSEDEFMGVLFGADLWEKTRYYFHEGELDCIYKCKFNIGRLNRELEMRYSESGELEFVNYAGYPDWDWMDWLWWISDAWYYDGNLNKLSYSEAFPPCH